MLTHERCRVRLPNGMTVAGLTETDTLSVYRDLFEDDCYRRYGVTVNDGDSVIDVGANTGLFALWLNGVVSRARLFCFEPVPAVYDVLVRNLQAHDRLGTVAVNAGLSDQEGTAAFTYYPLFSNASTMFPDRSARTAREAREWVIGQTPSLPGPLPWVVGLFPRWLKVAIAEGVRRYNLSGRRVRCRLTTLSAVLRERNIERVDLLKIDAERSEERILAGLDDADWPRIRQIVMEVHDGHEATEAMIRRLHARGFRAEAGPNPALPGLSLVYAVRG